MTRDEFDILQKLITANGALVPDAQLGRLKGLDGKVSRLRAVLPPGVEIRRDGWQGRRGTGYWLFAGEQAEVRPSTKYALTQRANREATLQAMNRGAGI